MKTITSRAALTAVVLALGAAGCGGDAGADSGAIGTAPTAAEDGHDETHGDGGHADAGHGTGGAAAATDADRTIEVAANDDLSFDPSTIQVTAGEVITFVVTNTGEAPHEFVLGDASIQQQHATEMAQGGHGDHAENAISIAPGATEQLTWSFTDVGQVLYGCHLPGHYDGGMVGTVTVDG